jgi:hypothetical protein
MSGHSCAKRSPAHQVPPVFSSPLRPLRQANRRAKARPCHTQLGHCHTGRKRYRAVMSRSCHSIAKRTDLVFCWANLLLAGASGSAVGRADPTIRPGPRRTRQFVGSAKTIISDHGIAGVDWHVTDAVIISISSDKRDTALHVRVSRPKIRRYSASKENSCLPTPDPLLCVF